MHKVLEGIIRNQRIASAYLFAGPPASAKTEDALAFAKRLGCAPLDQIRIKPDGAAIKIEQIREIQQVIRYGPAQSAYLAVMIERADALTAEAAAASLKMLEEPPPRVVFILLVEREDRLPATIASRCQKIVFGEEFKKWQANPENQSFYDELKGLRQKSIPEIFALSSKMEKERERIEDLLYDLAQFVKSGLGNHRLVRVLLEAVKNVKKKANLKIAMDVACLNMYETGN